MIAKGEVEMGLYNVSEIPEGKGLQLAGAVPPQLQINTTYEGALMSDGSGAAGGARLYSLHGPARRPRQMGRRQARAVGGSLRGLRVELPGAPRQGHDMRFRRSLRSYAWLLAAGLLLGSAPSLAQGVPGGAKPLTGEAYQAALEQYIRARRTFDEEAAGYWKAIGEKRQLRIAKRRARTIEVDDYVLTQPPVYSGPSRPVDPSRSADGRPPPAPSRSLPTS